MAFKAYSVGFRLSDEAVQDLYRPIFLNRTLRDRLQGRPQRVTSRWHQFERAYQLAQRSMIELSKFYWDERSAT